MDAGPDPAAGGPGPGRPARPGAAVASIEGYDSGLALDALITAEDAAIYAGSLADDALVDAIASTALRLLPRADAATPAELLVRGMAVRLTDGYAAAAPPLRRALAGLRRQIEDTGEIATPSAHEQANVLHLLAVNAAIALLDDSALDALTQSWVGFGRRTRTLTTLPIALDTRSVVDIFAARFRGRRLGDRRGRRDPRPRRVARPHRGPGPRRAAPRRLPR